MSTTIPTPLEVRLEHVERELAALKVRLAARAPAPPGRAARSLVALAVAVPIVALLIGSELQASGVGTKVKAPFTVVNLAGQEIMKVYETEGGQGVSVRNGRGIPAASIWANDNGTGRFTAYDGKSGTEATNNIALLGFVGNAPGALVPHLWVRAPDQGFAILEGDRLSIGFGDTADGYNPKSQVELGSSVDGGWLAFKKGGSELVTLSSAEGGKGGYLAIASEGAKGGSTEAGIRIGTTTTGAGVVQVLDGGKLRAAVSGGLGMFSAFSPSGQLLAEFGTNASASSGRYWLGNAGGEGIVEAGMLVDGKGTVRVGPVIGGSQGGLAIPDRLVGKTK